MPARPRSSGLGRRKPKLVARLGRATVAAERGERVSAKDVVRFVEEFAAKVAEAKGKARGVLLLIDEAGKALEFAAHHPERSDVHLLQELAEAASRSGDTPVVIGVFLHQAFDQYASRLGTSQRNEWAKVQGRYEDIPFQEAADQILRLVGVAIGLKSLPDAVRRNGSQVVDELVAVAAPPGMPDKAKLARMLSSTLPLHPVTALLVGPLFRSQLSQNERSLFAFLASSEPGAFQDFLEAPVQAKDTIETYRPDRLFNYLASAFGERLYRSGGRQWAQIDAALSRLPRDAEELDARIVKTVGLLGLLGDAAGLPASERVLQIALGDSSAASKKRISDSLERLRSASVLVFRRFKNSYQIWDGSDLDLEQRVRQALGEIDARTQVLRLLSRAVPPRPLVARRHLFETGTLRYFEVRYGDETVLDGEWAAQESVADGVAWILVPTGEGAARELKARLNKPATWSGLVGGAEKPVVIGVMSEAGQVRAAAAELAALEWVQAHTPELASDPVARKELSGRVLEAEQVLRQEMSGLITGDREAAWYHNGSVLPAVNGRQLSFQLSEICAAVYAKAPRVLNELLNRSQLSSAAAAARRELLIAMIEKRGERQLGIEGFPPELSMYRSVLEEHGLHKEVDGRWRFQEPKQARRGSLTPAIRAIRDWLGKDGIRQPVRRLYDLLGRPPYGIKEGLLPVLLLWVLLRNEAEVALYEEGAFVPVITGPVIERFLRGPDKFEIQRFEIAGAREDIFEEFTGQANLAEQGPLGLVRQLVKTIQDLPDFTRNTRELSPEAIRVRDTIFRAKEPGALIFRDLPEACGYEALAADHRSALPDGLVSDLQAALKELRSAYPSLLQKVRDQVGRAFGIPGQAAALRGELITRAKRLLAVASDPNLRTFLVRAGDDRLDVDGWTVSVATFLGGRPPESWSDPDLQRMSVALALIVRKFGALEAAFMEHQQAGMPEGSLAVRVAITEAGQAEAERVVLVRKDDRGQVDAIAQRLLEAVQSERADASRETIVASMAKVVRQLVEEMDQELDAAPETRE